ncbi:HNH endonuclease family protein [Rhodococcus sp. USK13]|uniref:HNH endonuclease family protein n=1 Tax=Rhodococcus sp. USK13 TaxID=2806442 RepID=UPI001BD19588|nr:HNH endonuclease family protein [Rhodococcus sp. USK13]
MQLRTRPVAATFAATLTAAALTLTGCSAAGAFPAGSSGAGAPAPAAPAPAAPAPAAPAVDTAATLTKLDALAVKGRAPKTGYSREQFGPSWSDDNGVEGGHNGCDTRNDILRRDLVEITYKPSTRDCVVATGTLHDPYTATTIAFVRGQDTSTAVQIDHVIALSDAWQKGAQQLSPERRRDLANDPRNLQAVDGPTNGQKSDSDAASWLPPNKGYRCTYVSRQIDVKALYNRWVTQAEKDAMIRVLAAC